MPVTEGNPAPYAPASAVMEFITKYRDHGLSEPFDTSVLSKTGIPDSLTQRTLQALQILDLITEDGKHTDTLEALRLATTAEFQDRLAEWVRSAYADIFRFTDPSSGDAVAIRDAFRTYNPRGQQPRMVSLFINLCKEAGITPKSAAIRGASKQSKTLTGKTKKRQTPQVKHQPPPPSTPGLPPALAGLLQELPVKGKAWDTKERDTFHAMLTSLLNYYYPVSEGSTNVAKESDQ